MDAENTIVNKKRETSRINAQKARQAKLDKLKEKKEKEALQKVHDNTDDDEFSEEEIVYIPTKKTKASKNKPNNTSPIDIPQRNKQYETFNYQKDIDELREQLRKLQTQPTQPQQPSPHHQIINHAKHKILNF